MGVMSHSVREVSQSGVKCGNNGSEWSTCGNNESLCGKMMSQSGVGVGGK